MKSISFERVAYLNTKQFSFCKQTLTAESHLPSNHLRIVEYTMKNLFIPGTSQLYHLIILFQDSYFRYIWQMPSGESYSLIVHVVDYFIGKSRVINLFSSNSILSDLLYFTCTSRTRITLLFITSLTLSSLDTVYFVFYEHVMLILIHFIILRLYFCFPLHFYFCLMHSGADRNKLLTFTLKS